MKIITASNKVEFSRESFDILKKASIETPNAYQKLLSQLKQLFPDIAAKIESNEMTIDEAKQQLQNMAAITASSGKVIITADIKSSIQKGLALLGLMSGLATSGIAGGMNLDPHTTVKTIEQTFRPKEMNYQDRMRREKLQEKRNELHYKLDQQEKVKKQQADLQAISGRKFIESTISKIPKDLISSDNMGGFMRFFHIAYNEKMKEARNVRFSFEGCILEKGANGFPSKATLKNPIIVQGKDIQFEIKDILFGFDGDFFQNNMEKLNRLNMLLEKDPKEVTLKGNLQSWEIYRFEYANIHRNPTISLGSVTFDFSQVINLSTNPQQYRAQDTPKQQTDNKNSISSQDSQADQGYYNGVKWGKDKAWELLNNERISPATITN